MTLFSKGKNAFLTFCLGRHEGKRITCGMEAGQSYCVRPSFRSFSMTVIGVIKTTQQPFSSVALPLPPSLPPSRRNRYPNGTGSCVRRRGAAWRRTKSIMQEEGQREREKGPWSGAGHEGKALVH